VTKDPLAKFLRDLERLQLARRMYPDGHRYIADAAEIALSSLREWGRPVRMSMVGEDLIVEDKSAHDLGDRLSGLATLLRKNGWEGVRISPHCGSSDLLEWMACALSSLQRPYSGSGVVAGKLDAASTRDGQHGAGGQAGCQDRDEAPAGYVAQLSDANDVLGELAQLRPGALAQAQRVVRSFAGQLRSGAALLEAVRRLKTFDEYSYTHALNVSILSMAMASHLGLPRDLTETIALGGLCHDTGKARIPSEVLNKPGKLDDAEWELLRRHPTLGAEILLSLPSGVHPLLPTIAYQHHMGVAADGYPAAVAGETPHPASLLVQVADIFDALRTIRPYRGTLSEKQAVNILFKDMHAGRVDRRCLGALLGVLELLAVGSPVELTDGRRAVVMAPPETASLEPLVETLEGDILDLADPAQPDIAQLLSDEDREEQPAVPGRVASETAASVSRSSTPAAESC
jgi:HD-GYP domain-containing protein (c-di-GMP phosphodiesterase class II)